MVGAKLRERGNARAELDRVLDMLADLPPGQIAKADGAIATAADLYVYPPRSFMRRLLSPLPSEAAQLATLQGLEYLFLFHHDGRLREAALLKIDEGLPTAFLVAAVLWRLNDWAAPVRQAAARCADRSFPLTAPALIAQAVAELLVRQASWRRWGDERGIVDRVMSREDVAAHLADLIVAAKTGPQGSTLRSALRVPALDQHLRRIAQEAAQPFVRAVALGALIDGKAEWRAGTAWAWTDKSMGCRRRIPVIEARPLSVAVPRRAYIEQGLKDRSAAVRKMALDALARHFPGTSEARALASPLLEDRSPSVRARAEFILRWGTN